MWTRLYEKNTDSVSEWFSDHCYERWKRQCMENLDDLNIKQICAKIVPWVLTPEKNKHDKKICTGMVSRVFTPEQNMRRKFVLICCRNLMVQQPEWNNSHCTENTVMTKNDKVHQIKFKFKAMFLGFFLLMWRNAFRKSQQWTGIYLL